MHFPHLSILLFYLIATIISIGLSLGFLGHGTCFRIEMTQFIFDWRWKSQNRICRATSIMSHFHFITGLIWTGFLFLCDTIMWIAFFFAVNCSSPTQALCCNLTAELQACSLSAWQQTELQKIYIYCPDSKIGTSLSLYVTKEMIVVQPLGFENCPCRRKACWRIAVW